MEEISKEQLESLAASLAHMRVRPMMWFSETVPAIQNFLYGFQAGCACIGFDIWKNEQEIWKERDWEIDSSHPIRQMSEKGMSDDEIAAEVFGMLILHLRRKYNISDESILKIHREIRENTEKSQHNIPNPLTTMMSKKHPELEEQLRNQLKNIIKALDSLERDMDISGKA